MIYCFVKNIQSVKINTEAVPVVSKKVDLGIIAAETERTHVSSWTECETKFQHNERKRRWVFETVAKCNIWDWHCQLRIA
jgi:hypothetical protein